ncbi:MAG: class IV adenylate cyclase [Candidatus Kerfeldbacteria bacterium]|nr:class IV adenylate cyclase [Candidatus Kerfeldbacteria bacterium]
MEIEIKAHIRNRPELERRLKQLGARYVGRKHQVDRYYQPFGLSFTKRSGKILRVRHDYISKETRLELHMSSGRYAATEIEVPVGDEAILRTVLKELRMKEAYAVEKKRRVYRLGKVEIVIDQVKGLGWFVEVEIQGANTKSNQLKLAKALERLGVARADWSKQHYNEMMGSKKGLTYAYF